MGFIGLINWRKGKSAESTLYSHNLRFPLREPTREEIRMAYLRLFILPISRLEPNESAVVRNEIGTKCLNTSLA